MLKYIDGTAVATNNSGRLFWEGYFTEEVSEVVKKIQSNDLGSIRGQYSFLYLDKTVKHGVSYNLGYPLYTNGVDYSNDPLDLKAKINYEKLCVLLTLLSEELVPFDPKYYDCFDGCELVQTTEELVPLFRTTEAIVNQFLETIEINTRNKSIAIMFGDGWDSHAMLNACNILGKKTTLVNVKSKTPTKVKTFSEDVILLDNVCSDVKDYSVHDYNHFNIQHMYMTSSPLDFDVILRGNDAEIYACHSKFWQLGYSNTIDVITRNTTRNSILELNTYNKWIDPFSNLTITSSFLAGNTDLKNRSLQKMLCQGTSFISSNDSSDIIHPEIESKQIFDNILYLKKFNLSNGAIKTLAQFESGRWVSTLRETLNRYV